MKSLILASVLLSWQLLGAPALTSNGAYELNKASSLHRKYSVGTKLYDAQQFGVKATYNYSVHGGAISTINLDDHDGKDVTLPAGAVITNCLIDVVTQPNSAGGTATLALTASSAGDLKAALDEDSWSNQIACIPDGTTGNMIKLASAKTLTVAIASEALTAGKVNVWVEYVLSE